MKKNELAAALRLAVQVCAIDKLEEQEKDIIFKELMAFNLSKENRDEVMKLCKNMSSFRACEILKDADENTKKEAASLCIVAMNADDDLSDQEAGAYLLAEQICNLPPMNYTEAKEHLKL